MGVLGDTLSEFKKASPQEKIFIVGGGIAALAIALYIHNQNTQANQPAQAQTAGAASLQGGGTTAQGGIQTVPSAQSGNIPILPQGLQPIFDAAGNLIAYQPIQQTPPITPTNPTPPNKPNPTIGTFWTLPGFNTWQVVGGTVGSPLVPFGASNRPSGVEGQFYTYQGKTYTQVLGDNGRIWGVPGKLSTQGAINTPEKVLLYAPASYYPPKQGGGPYGTAMQGIHRSRQVPKIPGQRQDSAIMRAYALRGRRI